MNPVPSHTLPASSTNGSGVSNSSRVRPPRFLLLLIYTPAPHPSQPVDARGVSTAVRQVDETGHGRWLTVSKGNSSFQACSIILRSLSRAPGGPYVQSPTAARSMPRHTEHQANVTTHVQPMMSRDAEAERAQHGAPIG